MSTLITIIVSIAYPVLFYICWTDNPQTSRRLNMRFVRIVYTINTISLLYVLFCCICCFIIKLLPEIQSQGLLMVVVAVLFPAICILLSRIIFLPYTHSILWTIIYIIYLKKKQFPKKETILFSILLVLTVLGLIGMELAFQGLMSHFGSV